MSLISLLTTSGVILRKSLSSKIDLCSNKTKKQTTIGTPKRRVDQVKKVVFEKNAFEFEVLFKHVIVNVETKLYFQQK